MLNNLGTVEVVVVSFVLLMLFGTKKLNEIAHGLGKTKKEFDKTKAELENTVAEELKSDKVTENKGGGKDA